MVQDALVFGPDGRHADDRGLVFHHAVEHALDDGRGLREIGHATGRELLGHVAHGVDEARVHRAVFSAGALLGRALALVATGQELDRDRADVARDELGHDVEAGMRLEREHLDEALRVGAREAVRERERLDSERLEGLGDRVDTVDVLGDDQAAVVEAT